jgi:hypothetical protein
MTPTPNAPHQANTYHAYLVRMWQDSPHAPWRASTHCVQTSEKRIFADLDTLFTFLRTQTVGSADNDGLRTGGDERPIKIEQDLAEKDT